MRALRRVVAVAGLLACWVVVTRAAVEYPLTMVADAQVKTEVAMVNASITIRVDRPMEPSRWTRVTDALKFNGYPGFLNTLRTLPSIGTIELGTRKVLLRYSHEQPAGAGSRLVLVADRPLFFLGEADKSRAGYELTIVEVTFDAQGRASGRMTGAARVKPAGDGGVVLDDFAEAPVQLSFRENRP
jgi:hypothetical protein